MKRKIKFNFMKKNQVVVAVSLADSVDLAEIGDAKLVSTQPANDSNLLEDNTVDTSANQVEKKQENKVEEKDDQTNTADKDVNTETKQKEVGNNHVQENKSVQTNVEVLVDEYFAKSRLDIKKY